jgi:hemoglobin
MATGLTAASFYERIGGGPALQLAVGEFYDLVLGDEELKEFFAATDVVQLKKHQAALLTRVLGGRHRVAMEPCSD